MPSAVSDVLARSRLVRDYEAAFRRATGMWLKLLPPDVAAGQAPRVWKGSPLCALIAKTPRGRETCKKVKAEVQQRAGENSSPQARLCFAGLSVVAVPVVVDGSYVATLLAGPVLRRKPTRRDWDRVAKVLADWGLDGQTPRARSAYRRTRVVGGSQFCGVMELLRIFAEQLGRYAGCCRAASPHDPPYVARAKELVQQRMEERVTMREAARHVHLSPHYFCRMFKKATGMTFSECVARSRVEKAKTLLHDPFMRISEAAFKAGFGSIPHFNALFRKYAGKSPTEFRNSLRQEFHI